MKISTTNSILLRSLVQDDPVDRMWSEFYNTYERPIIGWCIRCGLSAHEAEDMFHDIMLKLLAELASYDRTKGKFRSWLKVVVENAVRDLFREKHSGAVEFAADDLEDLAEWRETDALLNVIEREATDAAEIFRRARSRVKEKAWDAFIRRDYLGESIESLAAELGLKKTSFYQTVWRVRKTIREIAREYYSSTG